MRDTIVNKAKLHLSTELDKSPLREELRDLALELDAAVRDEINREFTKEELEIFTKWKKNAYVLLRITQKYDDPNVYLYDTWNHGTKNITKLAKLPAIDIPDVGIRETICNRVFKQFPADKLARLYKLCDLITCEENSALEKLKRLLKKYNTTLQLITDHPHLKDYMTDEMLYTNPTKERILKQPDSKELSELFTKTKDTIDSVETL
jgi:hypothetical protein